MTNESAAEPFRRISVAEAQAKFAARSAQFIDIRMPFDYAGGRIPGSMSLPNNAIRFRKSDVPTDKELLFISEDGTRSPEVCRLAASLGFKDIANVEGGYAAWVAAGYATETLTEGYASGGSPLINARRPDPE